MENAKLDIHSKRPAMFIIQHKVNVLINSTNKSRNASRPPSSREIGRSILDCVNQVLVSNPPPNWCEMFYGISDTHTTQ
jgi:hypothetical protein